MYVYVFIYTNAYEVTSDSHKYFIFGNLICSFTYTYIQIKTERQPHACLPTCINTYACFMPTYIICGYLSRHI